MLRFPRLAVARFVALVRADFAGVRAGFIALFISSGGDLVTGLTLASITHTLQTLPGLFILIPAAIGMRGNIFGGLGSRLGTQIHAGTFRVSRRIDTLFGMTDDTFRNVDESMHYALTRYLCQWLDEKNQLWPFYRAYRDDVARDPTGAHAFERITGLTPEAAQKPWRGWLFRL